ncbi:hypothetical protein SAMN04488514_101240 [Kriegella aquimaris]|uniref:Uncharacterized protein n=1 Tax=Kriegella aquimaris TaxID=192904 RepID=A0A1G9IQN1_9FLAO|nr:hypothetical protein SAMN04488514_101240 [Kriegella aquimaris]
MSHHNFYFIYARVHFYASHLYRNSFHYYDLNKLVLETPNF